MLHPPQQRRKRSRHTDDMLQAKLNKKPARLFAVLALVLLGVATTLSIVRNSRDLRAVGLMPEVVCTADRPRLVMDEVVVRAPNPNRIAVAAARVSGIN
jgi:hypothetical protein